MKYKDPPLHKAVASILFWDIAVPLLVLFAWCMLLSLFVVNC